MAAALFVVTLATFLNQALEFFFFQNSIVNALFMTGLFCIDVSVVKKLWEPKSLIWDKCIAALLAIAASILPMYVMASLSEGASAFQHLELLSAVDFKCGKILCFKQETLAEPNVKVYRLWKAFGLFPVCSQLALSPNQDSIRWGKTVAGDSVLTLYGFYNHGYDKVLTFDGSGKLISAIEREPLNVPRALHGSP